MEDKWVIYDDEETEVQLELADLIFDKLVSETTDLIAQIYEKRHGVPIIEKKEELLPSSGNVSEKVDGGDRISQKSSARSTPKLDRKNSF
jgi:hypothetical protein